MFYSYWIHFFILITKTAGVSIRTLIGWYELLVGSGLLPIGYLEQLAARAWRVPAGSAEPPPLVQPRDTEHYKYVLNKKVPDFTKSKCLPVHCKDTIPKIRNKYSQKRNCASLSPNFHIHVSVSDLNISTMGLPILLQGGPILGIYESLTDIWMWKLGLRLRNPFLGKLTMRAILIPELCCGKKEFNT